MPMPTDRAFLLKRFNASTIRRRFALFAFLLLPAFVRADEVPFESFEWNPMLPEELVPGPLDHDAWPYTAGSDFVTVTDLDAADGAQSILIGRQGIPTRLELAGHLPLADLMPVFVDFWLRPTSWSGTGQNYGLPTPLAQGTQIFVDGHFFSFFQPSSLNNPLRLYYHDQLSGSNWLSPGLVEPALDMWVPIFDRPTSTSEVSAKEWVRFTTRIDPVRPGFVTSDTSVARQRSVIPARIGDR